MLRNCDNLRFPMNHENPRPPIALTIAGSDSGGGAGIQADLHTFAAFGVHGLSAITAVTAQNTRAVTAALTLPGALLRAQLEAVLDDYPVAAAKIGMLGSPAVVRLLARILADHPRLPVVLDPVLVATTGATLGSSAVAAAMRRHLFERAVLVTPNLPEAGQLLGREVDSVAAMPAAAHALAGLGARAVLLKGGHLAGGVVSDLLLVDGHEYRFEHERIDVEGHGTGCTLSAAIAANLALGASLPDAVAVAIDYVHRALLASYRPGAGHVSVLGHRRAAP